MNQPNHNLDAQFDRLVDGELSPTEYRAFLASLDDQPDGWRRCALAFLEAQALRGTLSSMIPVTPTKPAVPNTAQDRAAAPSEAAVSRPTDSQRWSQALYLATVAASLVLAFYLGSWTKPPSISPSDYLAQSSRNDADAVANTPVDKGRSVAQSPAARETSPRNSPLGNVTLAVNGSEDQQIDVPVYGQEQLDAWRTTNKPVLPDDVIQQLQAAGHKVSHQENWVRVQMENGQEALVPVDDYRIQPRLGPAY